MTREFICQNFCAYYKPDKIEEIGCGGVSLLEKTPCSQLDLLSDLASRASSPSSDEDPLFGLDENDSALAAVCSECSFRIDGCDFRDDNVPNSACSPCGGLRAVAALISSGVEIDALKTNN